MVEYTICNDECHIDEKCVYISCGHLFHSSCLRKWTYHQNRCPLYRTKICKKDYRFIYQILPHLPEDDHPETRQQPIDTAKEVIFLGVFQSQKETAVLKAVSSSDESLPPAERLMRQNIAKG